VVRLSGRMGQRRVLGQTRDDKSRKSFLAICQDCKDIKIVRMEDIDRQCRACMSISRPITARWHHMMERCYNSSFKTYSDYGGRGILVSDEWQERGNFIRWSLANGFSLDLELDRINNNGYSSDNCRWVTRKRNASNRRDSFVITAFGETKCLTEWIADDRCSVSRNTLKKRIFSGQSIENAMNR